MCSDLEEKCCNTTEDLHAGLIVNERASTGRLTLSHYLGELKHLHGLACTQIHV